MARTTRLTPGPTQTAQIPLSVLTLVSFALAFGYLMARAVAFYQPAEYPLNWGNARWIGGEEAATTRYFRRSFDVRGIPEAAYLIVGGPDELAIYVNGNLVASKRYIGARIAEIRDIGRYLSEGQNLIAIKVSGQRWATQPMLIARLVLETVGGARRELLSGPEWKVSARETRNPAAQIDWKASTFDDHAWPNAVVAAAPEDAARLPLAMPEDVFARRKATWNIWSSNAEPQATLVRNFEVQGEVLRGAWLEVGFVGQYTIAINGRRLHSQVSTGANAQLFSVGRYLHSGANRLELSAETMQRLPRIYARLLVDTDKGKLWVPTDGRWMTAHEALGAAILYQPVQVLDRAGSRLQDRKTRSVLQDLSSDDALFAAEWWPVLAYAAHVLLAVALAFPLFHIAIRDRTTSIDRSLGVFVQPFLFGLLLLGALFLVDADPRYRATLGIGPTPMSVIVVLVLSWLALLLLEAILRRWGAE